MEITKFIKELLYGHDCVIVPGFGGFIGNYTPAQIDRPTGTFNPPVKQISFNRNLNHNDGLLVGRISESSGLNYGDARNIVGEFVEETRRKLLKGEKVLFEGIGSFINNHEGNVQFEPDRESNFHLNAFGLSSFRIMPLEGVESSGRIHRYADAGTSEHTSIRKYLWRAAVIIPIVGALIAVPLTTDLFRTRVQTTTLNPLASVEFEKNREAVDSNKELILPADSNITNSNVASEDSEKTAVISETVVSSEESAETFYVIAGSFQSEENAVVMMDKLLSEGFSPELIPAANGFLRVCAVKCSSMAEALGKRDSIITKYSGSWINRVK